MVCLVTFREQKKCFDYSLTLDTEDVENILFAITSVLQNLNYYEHLIPYMEKLIEMEPEFKAHLYDIAYAYEKIEDYENSILYYLKYLDEDRSQTAPGIILE